MKGLGLFLAAPYRPKCGRLWESFHFTRRLTVSLTLALSPLGSGAKQLLIAFILVFSLAGHTWVKPFARAGDNLAETCSMSLLLVSFIVSLVLNDPQKQQATGNISFRDGSIWFVFACNAAFVVVLGGFYLKRTAAKAKNRLMKKLKDRNDDKTVPLIEP